MKKHTVLPLIVVILTCTLALTMGIASANRSIEVRGAERGISAASRLTFSGPRGESRAVCDVTLRRTVTRLIPKITGSLFGKVTGIRIDRGETTRSPHCTTIEGTRAVHDIVPLVGPERPCTHSEDGRGILTYDCSRAEAILWKLIYDSFQGTLPRIEGVNIHIQGVQLRDVILGPFGETIECLYEGAVFGLIAIRRETRTATEARAVRERTRLRRISGSAFGCPPEGTFEGSFSVTPTLTIELI
jgi:hypothetical protein